MQIIRELERLAGFVAKPIGAVAPHGFDYWQQGVALVGQGVFDPGRNLGEAGPLDDFCFFQALEPFGKGFGADAGEGALQFAEAEGTVGQIAQDQGSPPIADQVGRLGDGTSDRGRARVFDVSNENFGNLHNDTTLGKRPN